MEFSSLSQRAAGEAARIEAARVQSEERNANRQQIAEFQRSIEERQRPLIAYAQELIGMSDEDELHHGYMERFHTSPLVKVGDIMGGGELFVSAREVYVSATYDEDSYPDFEHIKLNRWELVAAVGVCRQRGEFKDYSSSDDEISYLGQTLDGEGVFGRKLSVECLYSTIRPQLTIQAARQADLVHRESCDDMAGTIRLVRHGLASETLNPRGDRRVPTSLL